MQTKRANQSNENLYEIIKSNVSIRLLCNGFVLAVAPSTSRLKFMATEFSLQTSTVVAVVMVAAARRSATTNHYLPVPNLHIFNQLFFLLFACLLSRHTDEWRAANLMTKFLVQLGSIFSKLYFGLRESIHSKMKHSLRASVSDSERFKIDISIIGYSGEESSDENDYFCRCHPNSLVCSSCFLY